MLSSRGPEGPWRGRTSVRLRRIDRLYGEPGYIPAWVTRNDRDRNSDSEEPLVQPSTILDGLRVIARAIDAAHLRRESYDFGRELGFDRPSEHLDP
jgi:hypothetical protein